MRRLRPTACVSMRSTTSVCSASRERVKACWPRSDWWYRRLEERPMQCKKKRHEIFVAFFYCRSNKLQCAAEAAAAEWPPPDLSGFVIKINAFSETNIPAEI